jgi:hypothetical protein
LSIYSLNQTKKAKYIYFDTDIPFQQLAKPTNKASLLCIGFHVKIYGNHLLTGA